MKFALYPGCASKGSCPELYQSARVVCERLGIELVELLEAACCGAGVLHEGDPELALAINARTFDMAERKGLDILTICGTCQGVMAKANRELLDDPALLSRVNGVLAQDGRKYEGGVEIKHLLWIMVKEIGLKKIQDMVVRPLTGLKVAPFYGCYILRPSKNLQFDDPDDPSSLERLITALGAEPVEYAGRVKCCGFPLVLEKEEIAVSMVGANVGEAKDEGADCMVTPCPLCHMNLDIYQGKAEKKAGRDLDMPILHLPQLVGLAFGIPPRQLFLAQHLVPANSVLQKIGLLA